MFANFRFLRLRSLPACLAHLVLTPPSSISSSEDSEDISDSSSARALFLPLPLPLTLTLTLLVPCAP